MKSIKTSTVLATLLAVLYSLTINAQQIDQTFSGIEEIDISTASSNCILKKGSGDQVNVKLEHTYSEGFKPTVEKSGSTLQIRETHQNGSIGGDGSWTLTIPDGLEVDFNTGSGDFQAADLELELELNAGSGDFSLSGIKGEIESNTGSGDLELENFEGEVSANAGSGDMSVSQASGEVELNCGSGDISLREVNGEIEANVGSGDIEAMSLILADESSFNSGSGDVMVALSESLKHDISVNSGSGDAVLDFNGNEINGTVIMTADKQRGKITAPFSFDKEEEIENGGSTTIRKTARLGESTVKIRIGTGSGEARINN